jgi:prepilin-type N-terminal cleavage/methylation domain-containing protein
MLKLRKMKARKGFTLVELVTVIAIIAILSAVAIPRFAAMNDSARLASAESGIGVIRSAMMVYMSDNGGNYSGLSLDALRPYIADIASGVSVADHMRSRTRNSTWTLTPTSANDGATLTVVVSALENADRFGGSNPRHPNITAASSGVVTYTFNF